MVALVDWRVDAMNEGRIRLKFENFGYFDPMSGIRPN